ncbi:MAG: precorrin-8X methylmutase [Desulfomonilaceae bacterium]|nr:precorrin-8X methylmutase [Desulfomonilaceae bacterium]
MSEKPLDVNDRRVPLIHALYENPMSGRDIETRSFEIIDQETGSHRFPPEQWHVVRRMLHTTADLGLMDAVKFSDDAIDAAVVALRYGSPIYADSNMIRTGISISRLRQVCPVYDADRIVCFVADPEVAIEAREKGLPRSLFAVRKARSVLHGGIALFGNAPVALMELNRMIMEDGIRPALVVAMPVGFVHVTESKDELMSLNVPHVAITGRRGGSPIAVSVVHALCSVAMERK